MEPTAYAYDVGVRICAFSKKFHTFNQVFQLVKNHRSMGKLAHSI